MLHMVYFLKESFLLNIIIKKSTFHKINKNFKTFYLYYINFMKCTFFNNYI